MWYTIGVGDCEGEPIVLVRGFVVHECPLGVATFDAHISEAFNWMFVQPFVALHCLHLEMNVGLRHDRLNCLCTTPQPHFKPMSLCDLTSTVKGTLDICISR